MGRVISMGAGAADCRMSFVSVSMRRIKTAIANTTTAAQAAPARREGIQNAEAGRKKVDALIAARPGGDQQNKA